jgi:hypothetical protein
VGWQHLTLGFTHIVHGLDHILFVLESSCSPLAIGRGGQHVHARPSITLALTM